MSAETDALTRRYRQRNLALRAVTLRDLQRLWPRLDPQEASRSYAPFVAAVGLLLQRDRARANALAVEYLRTFRSAAGITGRLTVAAAPVTLEEERLSTALLVTSLIAYNKARSSGRSESEALDVAFVTTAGAVTRLMLESGRTTVRDSLAQDEQAIGWRRVTAPGACDWCLMLADRGAVYSARTAGFSAHDHCACSVEPAYGGNRQAVRPYEPFHVSDRRLSKATRDKNRERAKAWIAENRDRLRAAAASPAA